MKRGFPRTPIPKLFVTAALQADRSAVGLKRGEDEVFEKGPEGGIPLHPIPIFYSRPEKWKPAVSVFPAADKKFGRGFGGTFFKRFPQIFLIFLPG